MKHFRKFINDCYVDDLGDKEFDIVSNVDEEVYVRVKTNGSFELLDNDSFIIDTEEKKDALYNKVQAYLLDNKRESESTWWNNEREEQGIYNGQY